MTDAAGPNVVLVTIDSLRADHCGCYGYERDTTPTLDEMAANGVQFENAIAPGPATPESMPVIFTGEWPVNRGSDGDSELVQRRERIRAHMEARYTLPERMQDLGYETAAFTPNPFTSRHFGFDQGFDHFQDFMNDANRGSLYNNVFQGFLEGSNVSSLARVFMNFWQREEVFKPWESYYDHVVQWTETTDEPYFLWVFLMDVHNPYMSSSAYRTQSRLQALRANFEFWRQDHETPFSPSIHEKLVTAYDDSVRYSDAFLRRLRDDLADDDPVIAVHGDHGEAFGEHGTYGHEPYVYEENVRVPLVIDGVERGHVERPVSLRDLPKALTTLASGGDIDFPPGNLAIAQTRDGDAVSAWTPGQGYQTTLEVTDGREPSHSETPDVIERFVERHQVGGQEREAIVSSTREILDSQRL